jgi:RimJ/RimL family protein N-acetyltransferase
MLGEVVERAFGELGLRRLELGVYRHNTRALRLYERLGFRPFAVRPGAAHVDGRAWTSLEMELTPPAR